MSGKVGVQYQIVMIKGLLHYFHAMKKVIDVNNKCEITKTKFASEIGSFKC